MKPSEATHDEDNNLTKSESYEWDPTINNRVSYAGCSQFFKYSGNVFLKLEGLFVKWNNFEFSLQDLSISGCDFYFLFQGILYLDLYRVIYRFLRKIAWLFYISDF